MKRNRLPWPALVLLAFTLLPASALAAGAQDLSDKDRRLFVAVVGYEVNEAAALDALEDGANINAKNGAMGGETFLITEVKGFKDPKAVRFLLEHGADPNIKDDAGRTALSWARQYNIGNTAAGREIIKMLEEASGKKAAPANEENKAAPAPAEEKGANPPTAARQGGGARRTAPGPAAAAKPAKARRGSGPPTEDEVRETMEKSFTDVYQNHFFGVKNEVTFEWAGPITVGAIQSVRSAPAPCYPVKLKVSVTAKDPRDGNISTVARGQGANIGGFLKNEIFCFYRDGFGEWAYGTYER